MNGIVQSAAPCITVTTSGSLELQVTNTQTGCFSSSMQTISQLSIPQTTLETPQGTVVNCNLTSVTLDLTIPSGSTVIWRDALGNTIANSEDVQVGAGSYSYNVTGPSGCETSGTATVASDNTVPTVAVSVSNQLTCTDNTSLLDLTTNDAGHTITWLDDEGNTIAITEDIEVSSAGQYTVIVTDNNGCSAQQSVTVTADQLSLIHI